MKSSKDEIAAQSAEVMLGPNPIVGFKTRDMGREIVRSLRLAVTQPRHTLKAGRQLGNELLDVVKDQSSLVPHPRDRRFADSAWQDDPRYRRWLQAYLALEQAAEGWIKDQDLADHSRARLTFMSALVMSSIVPSNSPLQPEALRKFYETGGKSGLQGLKNLIKDIRENRGLPAQVDRSCFKVGENLAVTEGAVILRTELIELIQYRPSTEKVHKVPLLIVPPQINKYYVFDLSPEKSVVQGCLDAGFQVFVISWRNPGIEHGDWGLAEYTAAIEVAMSAVCNLAGTAKVNLVGACAGGVTLASFTAMRAAAGDSRINSLSNFVSVLDQSGSEETTLGLFATPKTIEAAKQYSKSKGVLDGKDMSAAFAWLRPNDLIWNYWVNNVLLGNSPPAFDVLYWNNDSTRLPARLHGEFLDIYRGNALAYPGKLRLHGLPVDLSRIDCDTYLIGGTTDHITPWQSCYRSTQLFGGENSFVLSNSGHIQSILNPPGNKRAEYWAGGALDADPKTWLGSAAHYEGSWWPHWHAWLAKRSGRKVLAEKSLGGEDYPELCVAPGEYVHG